MISAPEPSELLRKVFAAHTENYGDPDVQFHFDQQNSTLTALNYLDVFVWEPTEEIPMTTFSTIGMAERAMPECPHRTEIHWTLRGKLTEAQEEEAAVFLLNLAALPFVKNTFLDHWHVLPNLRIPHFGGCSAGLMHPSFVDGGWDHLHAENTIVKFLNFVPLTQSELDMARTMGVRRMLNALYESQTDIFSDRM